MLEDHNDFDIQINEDIFTSNAQWNYDEQNKPSNNIMTKSVSIGSENGIFALTSFLPNKKSWILFFYTLFVNEIFIWLKKKRSIRGQLVHIHSHVKY